MSILLENLVKRYDGQPVVNNVTLEIEDGEFFVLLGSSGSGKTTILNLIAGLIGLDSGKITLHGREVTHLPTQSRRVGFVFQNYALFQQMSIADNIEFGLSIRRVHKSQRNLKCDELLELVGLAGLGKRMPRQLSGGQQQRVALARALAYQPEVLLLDEPLGALDAKIRTELRRSLKAIQRKLGVTTILVTHDQEEAFDLADRIGVMSFGRLLEVGSPEELYQRPKSEFVATFLGSANLLVGRQNGENVQIGEIKLPYTAIPDLPPEKQRVQVLFRPEDVALASASQDLNCPNLGLADVEEITYGGSLQRLRLRLPPIPGVRPIAPPVSFGNDTILIDCTRSPDEMNHYPLERGDQTFVGVRRFHTLSHPGLHFLIVTEGGLSSQAAIAYGSQIARLAQARVTLLGCGQNVEYLEKHLVEARKQAGSGLASLQSIVLPVPILQAISTVIEHQPYDTLILGIDPLHDQSLIEDILMSTDQHLLLVPGPLSPPSKALISVTTGEPGKDDVLFAGRLVRHLGVEAAIMTVLASKVDFENQTTRVERFLQDGIKTLGILGVPAQTIIRTGNVRDQILGELVSGAFDMLVMGAPLPNKDGQISLEGVISEVLKSAGECATLMVRSESAKSRFSQITEAGMAHILEEIR